MRSFSLARRSTGTAGPPAVWMVVISSTAECFTKGILAKTRLPARDERYTHDGAGKKVFHEGWAKLFPAERWWNELLDFAEIRRVWIGHAIALTVVHLRCDVLSWSGEMFVRVFMVV
jgi:hypothetical protein